VKKDLEGHRETCYIALVEHKIGQVWGTSLEGGTHDMIWLTTLSQNEGVIDRHQTPLIAIKMAWISNFAWSQ